MSLLESIPVCLGCGFASQPDEIDTFRGICGECFDRRNHWQGGGPIRVIEHKGDVHDSPLCPEFDADTWYHWRDEDALYHTMSDRNDAEYCDTCTVFNWSPSDPEESSA